MTFINIVSNNTYFRLIKILLIVFIKKKLNLSVPKNVVQSIRAGIIKSGLLKLGFKSPRI